MRILLAALSALFLSSCDMPAPTGGGGISEPRFFIANALGPGCTRDNQGRGASVGAINSAFAALDGNAARYISDLRASTSLTVNKDAYAANWQPILFGSYAAAASGNEALAQSVVSGLVRLAQNNRYQSEPGLVTRDQALRINTCYADGPSSPCASHTPRFVGRMYANLIISAAVVEEFMSPDQKAAILPWLERGYSRFVVPELRTDQDGIYDFANMGLVRLAYAAITDDMGLAQRELSERRRQFIQDIDASGYIDQNSYRGVRALWYHTYGLDPALSYALVAREWGMNYFTDPSLGPRLRAAVDKTVLGLTDYESFRSVGNRGTAFSTDPADAETHVHQLALNLYAIAAREYGVRIPPSPRHSQLARIERYSTTSGLMASCYYSGR